MQSAEGLEAHISKTEQQQGSWARIKQLAGRIGLAVGLTLGTGSLVAIGSETLQAEQHVAEAEAEPQGVNNFDNAQVAAFGVSENGRKFATGWGMPGECMVSAQRWANEAAGKDIWNHSRNGVLSIYQDSGGVEVGLDRLKPGDILQRSSSGGDADTNWAHVHTMVFRGYGASGTVNIVDANRYLDGTVRVTDNYALSSPTGWRWHAFRMGKVKESSVSSETEPAIVARGNGALNIFYKDTSNRLEGIGWDATTGWNHASALTGNIVASNPTAVSRDPMKMEVFFRDVNNNLDNVGWSAENGWYPFVTRVADGSLAGDPDVISRSPDSLEVFYRNKQGNLMAIGWSALRGWAVPTTIVGDGRVGGNPVAVARSQGAMDILFRDRFGNLEDVGWDASVGWMPPQVRAYGMAGDPAAISRTPTSLDVFFRTAGNGVGEAYWDASFGWQGQYLGDNIVSDPTAIKRSEGEIELLYRSVNNQLMSRGWNATTGWAPNSVARLNNAQGNPSGVARGRYDIDIATKISGNYLADAGWNAAKGWAVTLPPTGENLS